MAFVLFVLLGVSMAATLAILLAGLAVMARGGDTNARWSNRLMRWRVIAQAVTIGFFVLAVLAAR